jgi:hypothetical protein
MADRKAINAFLNEKLSTLGRDGASAVEAAAWLSAAGLLDKGTSPDKHLRELLRTGKIMGAYQFPNKRWVIVNRSRLPDGIKRVVPIREAVKILRVSKATLKQHVLAGTLTPLDFGSSLLFFLEEDLKQFGDEAAGKPYDLLFPDEKKKKRSEIDKLRRQLYYLRSDVRLIAERIEELIRLLD